MGLLLESVSSLVQIIIEEATRGYTWWQVALGHGKVAKAVGELARGSVHDLLSNRHTSRGLGIESIGVWFVDDAVNGFI